MSDLVFVVGLGDFNRHESRLPHLVANVKRATSPRVGLMGTSEEISQSHE